MSGLRWRTNDMLVIVASTYRNAVRDGRSPVEAVAERLGIGYDAAKQRIRRARRAGKLTQTREVFDNGP